MKIVWNVGLAELLALELPEPSQAVNITKLQKQAIPMSIDNNFFINQAPYFYLFISPYQTVCCNVHSRKQ